MAKREYWYPQVRMDRGQYEKLQEIIKKEPWLDMHTLVRCAVHRFLESGADNIIRFDPGEKRRVI
jgi:hypothetical protein